VHSYRTTRRYARQGGTFHSLSCSQRPLSCTTPRMSDQPYRPTQDNTNTEEMRTNTNASSRIRTHDSSAWAGEDISCPIPRRYCDRFL
jgi:hypothetical protein